VGIVGLLGHERKLKDDSSSNGDSLSPVLYQEIKQISAEGERIAEVALKELDKLGLDTGGSRIGQTIKIG
jgi:hypothetical protein